MCAEDCLPENVTATTSQTAKYQKGPIVIGILDFPPVQHTVKPSKTIQALRFPVCAIENSMIIILCGFQPPYHCARRRGRNRHMATPFDSRGVYRGRAFDQCILVLTSSHPTPFASAERFWL